MNNINSMDDDTPLTWSGNAHAGNGASGSGSGTVGGYGSISVPVGNSQQRPIASGNAPAVGSIAWQGIAAALNFQLAPMPTKDDVAYVIVLNDNSCLELEEQQRLTGRELIGLCKFFNIVCAAQQSKIDVKWSELIGALGIERHFVPGLSDHLNYDTDAKTLFIFLIDAK